MMDTDKAILMLIRDEGWRNHPYTDTTGHLTIGVGHNLTDNGLSDDVIRIVLLEDIAIAEDGARDIFGAHWHTLSEPRQLAIINMIFNLGVEGFKKWPNTIAAIKAGQWKEVERLLRNSKWARQVKSRADRVIRMFTENEVPDA